MTGRGERVSCSEIILKLDEYVDRALSPADLRVVEAHLADCLHCASQFRFEVALIHSIRDRLRRIQVPPRLMETVLRRLAAESATS